LEFGVKSWTPNFGASLVDVVRSGILGYKTFNIEVTVGKDHIRKEIPT